MFRSTAPELMSVLKPVVAKDAMPVLAPGAVTVNPNTCLSSPKLPVPLQTCVQTTSVPPASTCAVHSRLTRSRNPPVGA